MPTTITCQQISHTAFGVLLQAHESHVTSDTTVTIASITVAVCNNSHSVQEPEPLCTAHITAFCLAFQVRLRREVGKEALHFISAG